MAGEQVSEAVLRELYQGDPAEFVAARDRRVEQARKAGDEALAAAIKALRKPTTAAWAVNRVAAEQRVRVAELIEVGDELRAAQRELRGDEIRRLDRRRTELVRELTEQAADVVSRTGKRLGEQARRQVESTFAAAVAEPESGRRVQAGVLSGALTYSGFGLDELSVAAMRSATSNRHESGARRGGRRRTHTRSGRGNGASERKAGPERSGADGEDRETGSADRRAGGDRKARRKSGTSAGTAERREIAKPARRTKTDGEQAPRPDTGQESDSGLDEAAELLRQAEDELRAAEQERDDQERDRDELRARLDDLSARLRDTTRNVSRARRQRDTARRRYDSLRQRR